jgi:undecaprenyl-diphosphatase
MTTFFSRRWWFVWLALALIALGFSFALDAPTQAWLADRQTAALKTFMRNVSRWGDWPTHIALGVVAAVVALVVRSRRWLAIFAAMVIACGAAGMANRVIKIAAGRSRPAVVTDAGWHGPRFSSKYNAFPSGHTASSTAFFGSLCLARRRIGLLFLPIPMLIAFARLYVGAHHLSDVVAGALLGVACAALLTPSVRARIASPAIAGGEIAR